MLTNTSKNKVWYGVDLDETHLVLTRLNGPGSRGEPEVIFNGDIATLARATQVQLALDEMAGGLAGTAACMRVQDSLIRNLSAPISRLSRAEKVFPSLLDLQMPFPLESCLYSLVKPHRTPGGSCETLAVAARREDIAQTITRHQAHRLDPVAIDQEALALWWGAFRDQPLVPGVPRILVWLGHHHTVFIRGQDEDCTAAISFREGFADLFESVTAATCQARLSPRLRPLLNEWLENKVVQWVWAGPGCLKKETLRQAGDWLGLPATVKQTVARNPDTLLACALALRQVEAPDTLCELRKNDLIHKTARDWQQKTNAAAKRMAMTACGAVCLLNLAWLGLQSQHAAKLDRALHNEAVRISGLPNPPHGQEVMVSERAMGPKTAQLQAYQLALDQPVLHTLETLLRAMPPGTQLGQTTLRETQLALRLAAPDASSVEKIRSALLSAGWTVATEPVEQGFTMKGSR